MAIVIFRHFFADFDAAITKIYVFGDSYLQCSPINDDDATLGTTGTSGEVLLLARREKYSDVVSIFLKINPWIN